MQPKDINSSTLRNVPATGRSLWRPRTFPGEQRGACGATNEARIVAASAEGRDKAKERGDAIGRLDEGVAPYDAHIHINHAGCVEVGRLVVRRGLLKHVLQKHVCSNGARDGARDWRREERRTRLRHGARIGAWQWWRTALLQRGGQRFEWQAMCDAVMRTCIEVTLDVLKLVVWLYDPASLNMYCRYAFGAMVRVRSDERGARAPRASARGNGEARHSFSAAGGDSRGRLCATPRCVLS